MTPLEPGKAAVVPVGRNPFASVFHGHRCIERIGNKITFGVGFPAQAGEYLPVIRPRGNRHSIGLVADLIAEFHGVGERAGGIEHAWVGDYPQEPADY